MNEAMAVLKCITVKADLMLLVINYQILKFLNPNFTILIRRTKLNLVSYSKSIIY